VKFGKAPVRYLPILTRWTRAMDASPSEPTDAGRKGDAEDEDGQRQRPPHGHGRRRALRGFRTRREIACDAVPLTRNRG
jgi:hypothetical protein